MTYYICYDTNGSCLGQIAPPYCFAFSEEELEVAIAYALEKYALEDRDICIFALTNKKVKSKIVKKTQVIKEIKVEIK